MSKKPISQKQALRKQQERAALNNIFNVFLTGLGAECLLFLLYRFYINGSVNSFLVWDNVMRVVVWLGLILFLGGIAAAVVKKADQKIRKIGLIAGFSGLSLSMISWVSTRFYESGVTGLCIFVPVVTVLGLVYFLYQRDCFVSTVLLAGTLLTIWVCGKGAAGYWATLVLACTAAVVVGLAALLVIISKIRKNSGKFCGIQFFSHDCDYRLLTGVCLGCIAAILLAVFVPTVSFYLTWVLVIALFAELGYYTTKLM